MRIFNLLILCLLCGTAIFAQDKDRAAQMMKTIEQEKWDKEDFLSTFEEDLKEFAAYNKDLSLLTVTIDRNTGMISATVKNAKGKKQAMSGTELLTELHDSSSENTTTRYSYSFFPDWLCWLLGCDDDEPAPPPTTDGDLTPEEKKAIDQRRRAAGLPPLFPGEY